MSHHRLKCSYPSLKQLILLLLALMLLAVLSAAGCQDRRPSSQPPSDLAQNVISSTGLPSISSAKTVPFKHHSSVLGTELAPLQHYSSAKGRVKIKYNSGEDPEYAARKGWPRKYPAPLPGAVLPGKRVVAYYGNPLSKRMGALGEFPKDDMLRRLQAEVVRWQQADPSVPVQPALHLIAVVAQNDPGKSGKYRMVMPDDLVNKVYGWAKESGAILFLDIQTGHDDIRALLPRFEQILKNPDVHLGIDPEFNLITSKAKPGKKIGTFDAEDINYVTHYLKELVQKYQIPPKMLVIHRFTRNGVTNAARIQLRPEVQVVMHMDGWGAPWLKRDSYKDYIVAEPVQFTGFKLFYHNDTKKGDPLMTPQDLLKLNPRPIYIQYQ